MTCNQLMILLAIYRGSLDCEHRPMTTADDLAALKRIGLIVGDDTQIQGWHTTIAGDRHVRRLLSLGVR